MNVYSKSYLRQVVETQGELFDMFARRYPNSDTDDFIVSYMCGRTRAAIDVGQAYVCTMSADGLLERALSEDGYRPKQGIAMSGFMPDLIMCSNCANFSDNIKFNFIPSKGQLICDDCLKNLQQKISSINLNNNVLAALRFITYADFNKMFSFSISVENQSILSFVTESYLLHCIDKRLSTLDFYKKLKF